MKTRVLCVLCIHFSTPSLLIGRRNRPPHTHCISDGTFAHLDVDVSVYFTFWKFLLILEKTDLYL